VTNNEKEDVMSLNLNRREICTGGMLLVLTSGTIHVARGAGLLPDDEAYSLWQLWNDPSLRGTPLALVAAGVLAANPHDTQPWIFHVRDDEIAIYADLSRNLGAMDAFVREMHLGLGCAVQNMLLAAPANGFAADVDVVPGTLLVLHERRGPVLAATLRLTRTGSRAPDALYRAIPERHTNRYAYNRAKPLPREWRDFAGHADVSDDVRVVLFEDGPARRDFDSLVIEATEAIIADKAMIADSDRWVRTSHNEIEAHRDGPTLDAAGLSTFTLFFAKLIPVSPEMSHDGWLSQTRDKQVPTASLTGFIAVRDRYDRTATIAAGRTWQRLHLSATAHGIAMQPLNQPIEMIDREKQLGRGTHWADRVAKLTGPDWQATFSFRAGYADQTAGPSPRRALHDVVKM
jgi:hypothetical protein